MTFQNFDLSVVGHFSIDSISLPTNRTSYTSLGGAVTFVSLVSRCLGAKTSIISKIGEDFPEEYLKELQDEGIDLSGVKRIPGETSTRFALEYDETQNRRLKLISKAPPITVEDLPVSLNAKIVHVAPIAGEVQCDVVRQLRNAAGVLSLDPQGLLRSFDKKGYISYRSPIDRQLFSLVNVYKSSQDEIFAVTGKTDLKSSVEAIHTLGVNIVIVTQGPSGSTISFGGKNYKIPAYPCRRIVDPTGAGDVFIGAFLAEYLRQEDLLWCASVGSAAASLVVESLGSTFLGSKQEIYKRAETIYEKEIKQ
jgi:cytidine kinase